MAGNLSPKLSWELANPKWAATLNALLSNPIVNGRILDNLAITIGLNTINHGLGRKLVGWAVIRNSANETFWDEQSDNSLSDLTLDLVASGAATISLYVF